MSRIHRLDAHVVNQIAAGEVVERPASVAKELLENSIDALATRIEVDVSAGGTELIRITDDGEGIDPGDLQLAVASHATSKIAAAEDLFRVQTLGFRGEALASIAAVSRLSIRSRRDGSDAGCEIVADCGLVGDVQPCGCPSGTRVEVRQLFAGTPVRRRFLKATSTEFGHIGEQFTRIALAHPRLHAVLRHNDRQVYELPASVQLIDRLRLFYGAELADDLIRIDSQTDAVRLWGYVAHPSRSKSTRKGQYLFLNGRWIQDRSLQHALGESYRGLLMTGRFPIAFLFLEMPPDLVDVNVHPTKAEVRFRDGQALYRQLLSTLRTTFLGMDLDSRMSIANTHNPSGPPPAVDPARQRELQMELAEWAKGQLAVWQPDEPAAVADTADPATAEAWPTDDARNHMAGSALESMTALPLPAAHLPPDAVPPDVSHHHESPGLSATSTSISRVMQVHDCYLVAETDDGLTVIDQHALHERVIYEQLRGRVMGGVAESQRLLVPDSIELGAGEASALVEHRELLAELGYEIEEFGRGTVLLSAYPSLLHRADHRRIIQDIAEQLMDAHASPTRRDMIDGLLHMMACKAAVKSGDRLTPEEIESLLGYRHLIDDSHHCPHGRPTALKLSRTELDRQFGRLG